jgi:NADH:ubiquinone oxidoreductase subunit C
MRLPQDIEARLRAAAPHGVEFSSAVTPLGVTTAWCGLADTDDLLPVAQAMLATGARLSMISASLLPTPPEEEEEEEESEGEEGAAAKAPKPVPMTFGGTPIDGTSYEIDYHFDLEGDTLTVIAYVPHGGGVVSLTPIFRTADWAEREMMENYAIAIREHPDPRRLFIDPAIDSAVLERLIPFSTLVNAASTKSLWDKVMAGKGGAS